MNIKAENGKLLIDLPERIDGANAGDIDNEIAAALSANAGLVPEFDASALSYISSAGLRVLLKCQKQFAGKKLVVRNVSLPVYDICETTGFTDLLDIKKGLRTVDVSGLEVIGQGGNGKVYRIDRDTILKAYNKGNTLESIESRKKYMRAAFTAGVPTAISFDTVKVLSDEGESYGIVFELLGAQSAGQVISENPAALPEISGKLGKLLKTLHTSRPEAGTFPTIKEKIYGWIDILEKNYISREDADIMRNAIKAAPESETFIHCDFHEGNIIMENGEPLLIDMDDICVGHPIFDLTFIFLNHVIAAQNAPDVTRFSLQMSPENAIASYREILKSYFDTDDESEILKYEQITNAFVPLLMILSPAKSANSKNLPKERAQLLVDTILPQVRQTAPTLPKLFKLLQTAPGKKTADKPSNSIYQVALLQSLMQGEYDGVTTVEKLAQYGDIGIGTFEGVNGEMIVWEGVIYQALADGSVIVADPGDTVPFANVTFFMPDINIKDVKAVDIEELKKQLDVIMAENGQNQFCIVKLTGHFASVQVRSALKQKPPYRYLNLAMAADQRIFDYENLDGHLVALYCPAYMDGLNMPGWHFHFLSADKSKGGHVLGLSLESGDGEVDIISSFKMIVPDRKSFNEKHLEADMTSEIHATE